MRLEQFRRQTDGTIGIVSGRAVFDTDDVHRKSSSREYTASPGDGAGGASGRAAAQRVPFIVSTGFISYGRRRVSVG
jgi:hypothetical protein